MRIKESGEEGREEALWQQTGEAQLRNVRSEECLEGMVHERKGLVQLGM